MAAPALTIPALREDKKLTMFFSNDEIAHKRMKTAARFCKGTDDATATFFVKSFAMQILQVVSETLDEYHSTADRVVEEAKMEKSGSFFSRFKREKAKMPGADKLDMLFDLLSRIVDAQAEQLADGWSEQIIDYCLERLVHREHELHFRKDALKLLLKTQRYRSRCQQRLSQIHIRLFLRAIDLHPFLKAPEAAGITGKLPPLPKAEAHPCFKADHAPSAADTVQCVQVFLTLIKEGADTPVAFRWLFGVLCDVLLVYLYPNVFGKLQAAEEASTPSASAAAGGSSGFAAAPTTQLPGLSPEQYSASEAAVNTSALMGFFPVCPPILQRYVLQWLITTIQASKASVRDCLFETVRNTEIVMEICRQSLQQAAFAADAIRMYRQLADGTQARPAAISSGVGLRWMLARCVDHAVEVCETPAPSSWSRRPPALWPPEADAASTSNADTLGTLWRSRVITTMDLLDDVSKVLATSVARDGADASGALVVARHLLEVFLHIADSHVRNRQFDEVVTPALCRYMIAGWLRFPPADLRSARHWAPLYAGVRRWLCSDAAVSSGLATAFLVAWRSQLLTHTDITIRTINAGSGGNEQAFVVNARLTRLITPRTLQSLAPTVHLAAVKSLTEAAALWLAALEQPGFETAGISRSSIVDLYGPWLFAVVEDANLELAESRAVGVQFFGRILCTRQVRPLNAEHVTRIVCLMANLLAATDNPPQLQLAVVQACSGALSADIPGITSLVPALLGAAVRLMSLPDSLGYTGPAVRCIVSLIGLPNRFPNLLAPVANLPTSLGVAVESTSADLSASASSAGLGSQWVRMSSLQAPIARVLATTLASGVVSLEIRRTIAWALASIAVDELQTEPRAGRERLASGPDVVRLCVKSLLDTAVETSKHMLAITAFDALSSLAIVVPQLVRICGMELVKTVFSLVSRHIEQLVESCVALANASVNTPTSIVMSGDDSKTANAPRRAVAALSTLLDWISAEPSPLPFDQAVANAVFAAAEAACLVNLRAEEWVPWAAAVLASVSSTSDAQRGSDEDTVRHVQRVNRLAQGVRVFQQLAARAAADTNMAKHFAEVQSIGEAGSMLLSHLYHAYNFPGAADRDRGLGGIRWVRPGSLVTKRPTELVIQHIPNRDEPRAIGAQACKGVPSCQVGSDTLCVAINDSVVITVHGLRTYLVDDASTGSIRIVQRTRHGLHMVDFTPVPSSATLQALMPLTADIPGPATPPKPPTRLISHPTDLAPADTHPANAHSHQPTPASRTGALLAAEPVVATTPEVLRDALDYIHSHYADCFEIADDPSMLGGVPALKMELQADIADSGGPETKTPEGPGTATHMADGRVRPMPRDVFVLRVLCDTRVYKLLYEFLCQEHAEDNDAWPYKYASAEARPHVAKRIVAQYIVANAPQWVNLNSAQFKKIIDSVNGGLFPESLFDEALDEIIKLINRDNVPRFLKWLEGKDNVPLGVTIMDSYLSIVGRYTQQQAHEHMFRDSRYSQQFIAHPTSGPVSLSAWCNTAVDSCRHFLAELGLLDPTVCNVVKLLKVGPKLQEHLEALDEMPARTLISTAVLLVLPDQLGIDTVVSNTAVPTDFLRFAQALGIMQDVKFVKKTSDGAESSVTVALPYFANAEFECVFHIAPLIHQAVKEVGLDASMSGDIILTDSVQVIWLEWGCQFDPDHYSIEGRSAAVYVVISPLTRTPGDLCAVRVLVSGSMEETGPLLDGMVVAQRALPSLVLQCTLSAYKQILAQRVRHIPGYAKRQRKLSKLVEDTELKGRQDAVLAATFARRDLA